MSQWKPVVDLREEIHHVGRVLGFHFTLEAVHFVHVFGLVIAPAHEEVVRVEQLEGEEREDALDGEGSAVDKVAVEQVRVVLRWNAVLETGTLRN